MIHFFEHLVLLPIIDGDHNAAGESNGDGCEDGMATGLWE